MSFLNYFPAWNEQDPRPRWSVTGQRFFPQHEEGDPWDIEQAKWMDPWEPKGVWITRRGYSSSWARFRPGPRPGWEIIHEKQPPRRNRRGIYEIYDIRDDGIYLANEDGRFGLMGAHREFSGYRWALNGVDMFETTYAIDVYSDGGQLIEESEGSSSISIATHDLTQTSYADITGLDGVAPEADISSGAIWPDWARRLKTSKGMSLLVRTESWSPLHTEQYDYLRLGKQPMGLVGWRSRWRPEGGDQKLLAAWVATNLHGVRT